MKTGLSRSNGVTEQAEASVLRRKLRQRVAPEEVAEPGLERGIGTALHRAGDATGGLRLALKSASADRVGIDDVMAELPGQGLLLRLTHDRGDAGILFFDPALVTSLVEIQTTGSVRNRDPQARAPTTTDAILCEGFANTLLRLINQIDPTGRSGQWMIGYRVAGRLANARSVAITLPDRTLERFDLSLDIEAGQRVGRLLMIAPEVAAGAMPDKSDGPLSWSEALARRVEGAPTSLTAVMAQKTMSLAEAEDLRPGDVLTFPREVLLNARLCGPGGRAVLFGRLGQMNGQRAIRIDLPDPPGAEEHPQPAPQDMAPQPPEPIDLPKPQPSAAPTPVMPEEDAIESVEEAPRDPQTEAEPGV